MTRRRFIADEWDRTQGTAALTADQALHLARVLRAAPGQVFDVVAGGFLHRAEVTLVHPEVAAPRVEFQLLEELESETALGLELVLAVYKFDHLEWAIEKATELGVDRISPILARRTEKHLAQAAERRVERWRKIAREAAKQSRRTSVPEIAIPVRLPEVLGRTAELPLRILLSEVEQATPLRQILEQESHRHAPGAWCALAIGPEGGWAPEELDQFSAHTWQPVTLGPRILRAETAAIFAMALAGALLS